MNWIAALLRMRRENHDLAEEMQEHLDEQIEELKAAGLNHKEAELAARRSFGNATIYRERSREVWAGGGLERLLQDIRYAFRGLAKNKLFAATAIAVLALGLGANTAIFSLVNAVLLRPLPYPDAGRLVVLDEYTAQAGSRTVSWPDFLDWRRGVQSFSEMAAYHLKQLTLTGLERPELLSGAEVSASFFHLVGAHPALGRTFSEAEDDSGANPVAVISYALWRNHLGGDAEIIGKTLHLNNSAYTVAGVLPPGFDYFRGNVDVYLPVGRNSHDPLWNRRGFHPELLVLARLKPGVTIQAAQAEMNAMMSALEHQYPQSNASMKASVTGLYTQRLGSVKPVLFTLFGAVGAVLLIACANVASLLVARGSARRSEIAIRVALGAGRGRLMRQLLTESVVLSMLGAASGLMLAYLSIHPLLRLAPAEIMKPGLVTFDGRVFAFAFLVSLTVGVLFGLGPSIQSAGFDVNSALKESGRGATPGGSRLSLRSTLCVLEIATAFVLVLASGLLVRSLLKAEGIDPGFDPSHVLALDVTLSPYQYQGSEQKVNFFTQAVDRVRSLPGVRSASAVDCPPVAGTCLNATSGAFWMEGRSAPAADAQVELPTTLFNIVAPGYFETMRIPLIAGRYFTDEDRAQTRPVLIINETMARQWWPSENPVGKRIKEGGPHSTQPYREIVGIVADVKQQALDAPQAAEAFLPVRQFPFAPWDSLQAMTFVVRAQGEPSSVADATEQTIRGLDKDLPITHIQPMTRYMADSLARRRFSTFLLGFFGAVALLLAAIGIYGVMAYKVNQQVREIGLRMALGASKADVLRIVLGNGLSIALAGIILGLAGARLVTGVLASLLFGVSSGDGITYLLVPVLVIAVSLAACYIPARRAMNLDPLAALRDQ